MCVLVFYGHFLCPSGALTHENVLLMRNAEVGPRQASQLSDQALIVLCEVTTFLVSLRN